MLTANYVKKHLSLEQTLKIREVMLHELEDTRGLRPNIQVISVAVDKKVGEILNSLEIGVEQHHPNSHLHNKGIDYILVTPKIK